MSLQFTRPEFYLCPSCSGKPGSPELCVECLERRELHDLVMSFQSIRIFSFDEFRVCKHCNGDGRQRYSCPRHGR